MQPIKINKKLVQKSLNKAGISYQVEAAQICDVFDEIVLEKNKKSQGNVKAFYFRDKILTILVANSLWASEIQMLSYEIIQKINKKFGKELVVRIQFKIAS